MAEAPFGGGDGQERTEQPTPRRRSEAARQGRVPYSSELSAATVLLAGTLALGLGGAAIIGTAVIDWFRVTLGGLTGDPLLSTAAERLLREGAFHVAAALAPFALAVAAVGVVTGLVQGRGVVTASRIAPKLSHLNPLAGLRRILGVQGFVTLAKALAKVLALGLVSWLAVRRALPEALELTALDVPAIVAVIETHAVRLATHVGLAFLVIAGADYAFQVYRHERGLRMTRQELKQEARETEGDPLIKSRVRSLMRAAARKRMLRDVARADVVVTNPTHIAVALRYDPREADAPIVLAMGERKLAERIKALARAAGVPLVENKPLAQALRATARVGRPIPVALYGAVAEVLAYVYRRTGGPR